MQKYDIKGMSCAACSARVQKAVEGVDGVTECSVNLLTNSMTVEGNANSAAIISAVTKAGYGAEISGGNKAGNAAKPKKKNPLLSRFLWSLLFLAALMYITMGHEMLSLPLPAFLAESRAATGLAEMLLCAAVMVINGRFFISGAKGALHLAPNMDTLVSLGAFASFAFSTAVLIETAFAAGYRSDIFGDFYFESAAMILTLVTLGKMLEAYSKGRTTNALEALKNLAPDTAAVIRNGAAVQVPVGEIGVGDIIAVRPGERVALDGVITKGESAVDESALTGEGIPVDKSAGDRVFSGTVNISGYIEFKVLATGEDTALGGIIRTVSDAAASKAPIAKLADKVAGIFVPAVLLIALVTAVIWLVIGADFSHALTRAVSVLVISCPCALGLATPVAIMVSAGVGAKHGILFKNAAAIEQAGKADVIVLDKTGTVTGGKPVVTDIIPAPGVLQDELLSAALSLESKSEHPLARAVVDYCAGRSVAVWEIKGFAAVSGGVKGEINGDTLLGGNTEFIGKNAGAVLFEDFAAQAQKLANEGKTPLFFARAKKSLGIIAVADGIKPEARRSIEALKGMGLRVIMLTGDNPLTAAATAKAAGIGEFRAGLLPGGKAEIIKELTAGHNKVLMVGDGINDAPALTVADTGVAIGAGTDIAVEAANIVLVRSNLCDLVSLIKLSRAAYRNIKQNLFWAFFYNSVCIPLAAGVFSPLGITLSPMIGAAAMSMSSVCVVLNALRLNLFKPYAIKEENGSKKEETVVKTIKVRGIMCEHCEARIKSALEAVAGVKSAKVSKDTGTAEVEISGEVDEKLLFAAIKGAGYEPEEP